MDKNSIKRKTILFYIAGSAPTAEEKTEAEELRVTGYRNAAISKTYGDPVEVDCLKVGGLVPATYLENKEITVVGKTGLAIKAKAEKKDDKKDSAK